MNKYKEIANALEDAFNAQDLQTRIEVGTTDNIDWSNIITDDNNTTTFCVLLPSGSSVVKTNAGLLQTEYLNLYIALPNEHPEQYSNGINKLQNAINTFIQNTLEIGGDIYQFGNNGLQANDFRVVKGHHVGILTQSLIVGTAGNMLDVAGAIVTITACDTDTTDSDYSEVADTLFGLFHYSMGRTKNYDPAPTQGSEETQKAFQSEDTTVVFDFYKIKENVLHRALSTSNKAYYYITLNDGDQNIVNNKKMYLTSYFQDGVVGGYANVKVTFTSGVLPDLT